MALSVHAEIAGPMHFFLERFETVLVAMALNRHAAKIEGPKHFIFQQFEIVSPKSDQKPDPTCSLPPLMTALNL